jgi:SNF2 family DNA or RNA helicase
MDRIHRLGQYRPIKIKRMIIENSIESRILELQQKKKALFDSTVGKDMSSLARVRWIHLVDGRRLSILVRTIIEYMGSSKIDFK